jgi:hypothetical protein
MKRFNEWKEDREKEEAEVTEFLVIAVFILLGIVSILS